jgi:cell wall-associated NlpC family hydrolase
MDCACNARRLVIALVLAASPAACAAHTATTESYLPSPFPNVRWPAPLAGAPSPLRVGVTADVLRTALSFQGVPYSWGGDDPATGFDCSGFVRYVLAQHHLPVPRTAAEQYRLGTRVDVKRLRGGDLVFFSTIAPGASHVGLALNALEFVHAPATSGVVRTERLDSPYWRARFIGARRLVPVSPAPSASE